MLWKNTIDCLGKKLKLKVKQFKIKIKEKKKRKKKQKYTHLGSNIFFFFFLHFGNSNEPNKIFSFEYILHKMIFTNQSNSKLSLKL